MRKPKYFLVYDFPDRENEVDLVIPAELITPADIRLLRKEAGGLICLAVAKEVAHKLSLPFLSDILKDCGFAELVEKKIPYGERSSFSLSINHVDTFTGITDYDRALTIKKFVEIVKSKNAKERFYKEFRSPGHVFLLIERENRKGHTELSIKLMKKFGYFPCAVICEMLADDFRALNKEKALEYARRRGYLFFEGKDLIN